MQKNPSQNDFSNRKMQIEGNFRYLSNIINRDMLLLLSKLILLFSRWKINGVPPNDPKYLLVLGPHTSAWDFIYALAVKTVLRMDTRFLGKAELFTGIGGFFFKMVGGYPVDRSKNTNLVDFVAEQYANHEKLSFALAPEGTRKYIPELKTGFYHIARKSGVPIYMVGLDFAKKMVTISEESFYAGEDMQADLERVKDFFKQHVAKYPEKTFPTFLREAN